MSMSINDEKLINALKILNKKADSILQGIEAVNELVSNINNHKVRSPMFKGPLPWKVTNKEVYMLRKQYTINEIQMITGYSAEEIQKKIKTHLDNNS